MKIILISVLSLFLSLFTPVSNIDDKSLFFDTCNNGYTSYHIIHIEETEQYCLQIVEGEVNQEVTYSIYFTSTTPKEYTMALKHSEYSKYYELQRNSRGDVIIYNLKPTGNIEVEISTKGIVTYSFEIEYKTIEQYKSISSVQIGKGQGLETSGISNNPKKPLTTTLSIIFIGVIMVSIIIILVLYSSKKGMFNQDVVDKEFEEQHKMRDEILNYVKEEKVIEVEAEDIIVQEQQQPKQVYEKVKDYELDEERDISLLLKQKGFNTNYNSLLTHEKNEVMLELMKMKDLNEITEEEYKKETIKLWMQ